MKMHQKLLQKALVLPRFTRWPSWLGNGNRIRPSLPWIWLTVEKKLYRRWKTVQRKSIKCRFSCFFIRLCKWSCADRQRGGSGDWFVPRNYNAAKRAKVKTWTLIDLRRNKQMSLARWRRLLEWVDHNRDKNEQQSDGGQAKIDDFNDNRSIERNSNEITSALDNDAVALQIKFSVGWWPKHPTWS